MPALHSLTGEEIFEINIRFLFTSTKANYLQCSFLQIFLENRLEKSAAVVIEVIFPCILLLTKIFHVFLGIETETTT